MKILEYAASIPEGKGGYLHPSGLTFVYQNRKIIDAKINNKPVDLKKIYKVTINNYLANGGDGYDMFKDWKRKSIDTGFIDADVLREYITTLGPIRTYDDKPRSIKK